MELVIMSIIGSLFFASFIGATVVLSFLFGIFYSTYYYDGSERDGRRHWSRLKHLLARLSFPLQKYYFSYEVIYHGEGLEQLVNDYQRKETALFVGCPHGLIAISSLFITALCQQKSHWDEVTPCIHRHVFAIPFLRDLALWLGAIDVSKENIIQRLKTHSIYLASGGCREMIIDVENDGIQQKHKGFLRLAYQEKKLIFPIIHRGQEKVFPSYTCRWLDKARHIILDMTGYPFPSFFIGPLPSKLTSHIFAPHNPSHYTTEDEFIDAYYKKLISLREQAQ